MTTPVHNDMFPEAYTAMAMAMNAPLSQKVETAIALLRHYEPLALKLNPAGYWLAYSGGKDSDVILQLAKMAGVKYQAVYNVTTLDPPELTRYIKHQHPEVRWNIPKISMLRRLVSKTNGPPTRFVRWCCEEYKEVSGKGSAKIIGVRADESARRAATWKQFLVRRSGNENDYIVCPILYWTDDDVWQFHREQNIPHCSLYDEIDAVGNPLFTRLGCIGCPLAGPKGQRKEFDRWPRFETAWKNAVRAYWDKWHGVPNLKGKPRWFEHFKTWENLWEWWITGTGKADAEDAEECQMNFLYTNHDGEGESK